MSSICFVSSHLLHLIFQLVLLLALKIPTTPKIASHIRDDLVRRTLCRSTSYLRRRRCTAIPLHLLRLRQCQARQTRSNLPDSPPDFCRASVIQAGDLIGRADCSVSGCCQFVGDVVLGFSCNLRCFHRRLTSSLPPISSSNSLCILFRRSGSLAENFQKKISLLWS